MSETRRWLLAIDTATHTIVVAAGTPEGDVIDSEVFEGRYRHSQELLPALTRLMDRAGLELAGLGGIIVGTGPGAFTGLRVGIATAKTLAHELGCPVVGIATSDVLLAAAAREGATGGITLLMPSGARDRLAISAGSAPVVVRGDEPAPDHGPGTIVAIDLDGRAPDDAIALGRQALRRLPVQLLALGALRLSRGETDDAERLVPAYAVAPRGAPATEPKGGVAWSRDPR